MLKTIAITLILASSASLAIAETNDKSTVQHYHAILTVPQSLPAQTTPPTYGPYQKECEALVKKTPPGTTANAKGTVSATLTTKGKKSFLNYTITYEGLSGPAMMAHFHYMPPGGPIVQTICGKPSAKPLAGVGVSEKKPLNGPFCNAKEHHANNGVIKHNYPLDGNSKISPPPTPPIATGTEEVTALAAGQLFVNLHTCLNMGGEVSGTLVPGPLPK